MHLAINEVTAKYFGAFIRAVFFMIGLFTVGIAIKYAINFRTESYYAVSQEIDMPAKQVKQQLSCLTRNIYWEAASEPFEGKVAVAQVTLNRMNSGKFPDTVCGVVNQRTVFVDKVVCQFSWLCEKNHINKPVHDKLFKESEEVAKMVLLEGFRLKSIDQALYYHADYVNPKWNKEKVTQIGRHIFYKDKQ